MASTEIGKSGKTGNQYFENFPLSGHHQWNKRKYYWECQLNLQVLCLETKRQSLFT